MYLSKSNFIFPCSAPTNGQERTMKKHMLKYIEEFIGTTKANTTASHIKSTEDPQALDEDSQALVHSLAERLRKADWWTDHSDDHDGRPSDDTAKSTRT